MKLTTVFILTIYTIAGCMNQTAEFGPMENIFYELPIQSETYVSRVVADDILYIQVSGTKTKKIFTEIYSKTVNSHWKSQKRIGPAIDGRDFQWQHQESPCELLYRDFSGETESLLNSPGDRPSLQLKIGEYLYDLSDSFYLLGHTFHATFTISPKMVESGHDLSITIIPEESQWMRVGFMEFGQCPGHQQKGFSVSPSLLDHQFIESQEKREYRVTLGVRRNRRNG